MDLSKEMRNPRKLIMKSRPGEAWFYVAAHGIQIYVANHKWKVASMSFNLTRRQLTRALEIMDDASHKPFCQQIRTALDSAAKLAPTRTKSEAK